MSPPRTIRNAQGYARLVSATPSADARSVRLVVDGMVLGHVHEFDLAGVQSQERDDLLHTKAY